MSDKQAPGLSTREGSGYRRGGTGKRASGSPSTGRMIGTRTEYTRPWWNAVTNWLLTLVLGERQEDWKDG